MTQVTIHEAKAHHSWLIKKVLQGEEVVIARRDCKPFLIGMIFMGQEQQVEEGALALPWVC